jgi:LysR family transcriptional regulator, nod-box dependent transcriptional activator
MSRFDLNLLIPLDALLSERNVTAAADRIGVTQPTMSGMLNRLREQLQDPLMVRVGKSFELTPRARELSERVRQLVLTVSDLVAPLPDGPISSIHRHFKIMASEFTLLTILPAVFRRAPVEAPGITFEVVPINNPAGQVFPGNVDLCITGNIVSDIEGWAASVLRTALIATNEFVGLVDKNHAIGDEMKLEEFLAYPHVATQFPGISQTVEDRGILGISAINPPRIRIPSFLAIGAIVGGTDYVGVVPERLLPCLPAHWPVRTVRLPPEFARVETRLLWHSRYEHDLVHRWLRTLVTDSARPEPGPTAEVTVPEPQS